MAICPVCQTENAADFGLVNCKSCGSPFFVEIDGAASAPSAPPVSAGGLEEIAESAPPALENFAADVMADADEIKSAENISAQSVSAEVAAPPPTMPPIEDLRAIADFGNSEASLAREGAYRFTLYIGGIDTSEIRQEIRHNLSDSRFLWDIDALLATIKNGELTINDVSAVKAALAIQRLKLLPVDLKWEQHAIHQNH